MPKNRSQILPIDHKTGQCRLDRDTLRNVAENVLLARPRDVEHFSLNLPSSYEIHDERNLLDVLTYELTRALLLKDSLEQDEPKGFFGKMTQYVSSFFESNDRKLIRELSKKQQKKEIKKHAKQLRKEYGFYWNQLEQKRQKMIQMIKDQQNHHPTSFKWDQVYLDFLMKELTALLTYRHPNDVEENREYLKTHQPHQVARFDESKYSVTHQPKAPKNAYDQAISYYQDQAKTHSLTRDTLYQSHREQAQNNADFARTTDICHSQRRNYSQACAEYARYDHDRRVYEEKMKFLQQRNQEWEQRKIALLPHDFLSSDREVLESHLTEKALRQKNGSVSSRGSSVRSDKTSEITDLDIYTRDIFSDHGAHHDDFLDEPAMDLKWREKPINSTPSSRNSQSPSTSTHIATSSDENCDHHEENVAIRVPYRKKKSQLPHETSRPASATLTRDCAHVVPQRTFIKPSGAQQSKSPKRL